MCWNFNPFFVVACVPFIHVYSSMFHIRNFNKDERKIKNKQWEFFATSTVSDVSDFCWPKLLTASRYWWCDIFHFALRINEDFKSFNYWECFLYSCNKEVLGSTQRSMALQIHPLDKTFFDFSNKNPFFRFEQIIDIDLMLKPDLQRVKHAEI